MKKTKKIAALVLSMVMAFSLMAVTAAAYGGEDHEHVCSEETIQPRRPPRVTCSYCGSGLVQVSSGTEGDQKYVECICTNAACTNRGVPVRVYW